MWAASLISTVLICAGAVSGRPGWHLDEFFPLASEQLDTIVSPNAQSSHMHRIFGASGFKAAFNFDDNRASSCSSVAFQADMSNYWMPQLYWVDDTPSGKQFAPLGVTSRVYYFLSENTPNSNVSAFPDGLRILSGNPNAKASTGQYAFSCQRNRNLTDIVQGPDFNFDMDCPFGIKTNMYYENCWNGKDLWLPGNAHMSYPAGGNPRFGPCPWSHPVRVPSMMLEAVWLPGDYAPGSKVKGHLAWANGDTTGYGFHADFTNGWDRDVFQRALDSPACYGNGDNIAMSACPVFAASMDVNKARACRPTAGTLIEPTGVLENAAISALPGCNPLWGTEPTKPTCNPAVPKLDGLSKLLGTNGPLVAKAEQQRQLVLPTSGGWKRIGCISTGGLTNQISYQDTGRLTQDRCTETCLESGYRYAAVGNHADTCYCGTGIDPGVAFQEGMCTVPCPGNSTQTCGNEYIVDVLYAPPGTVATTSGQELRGCYQPSGSQSLTSTAFYSYLSGALTKQTCVQACVNRNATWAMTTAGVNCYCGNADLEGASATGGNYIPMDRCDRPCSGNSSEMCGGQYVGSLYNLSASSVPVALPNKPTGWLGCYSGGGNAVSDVTWLNGSLTVASCVNGCSEMGYKYGSVSVGNKCQCGNTDENFGSRLPASECTTPCKGNATQTCGATYYAEIYDVVKGADYTYDQVRATYPTGWMGCFASTGSNQQLTDYSWSTNNMNVETCKAGCVQFGYPYAGLNNKNTCNCGSEPTSRRMPHENCNLACAGNSTQFCGSSGFLDVYNVTAMNSGDSSSSTPSSYVGCYQDASNPRGLNSYTWTSDSMTTAMCRQGCLELGPYQLAATESGNACFCGNKWASGGILPESSCATACKGNSSAVCGGNWAASVYNTTNAPIAAASKAPGWQGCYPSGSFSAAFYNSPSMTSASCRASCSAQGYAYAATRSGTNCYCAQTLPASNTRNPGTNCNVACSGNSTETCGAAYLVDAYEVKSLGAPTSGYVGCFSDVSKVNNVTYVSTYMTRDTCSQYCQARSFPFAMTTYGNRCWCGSNRPVQQRADSDCSTTCTGNNTLTCGGNNLGSVVSLAGANVSPAISLAADDKGYVGCFAEGNPKLANLVVTVATNTPTTCQSTCKGLGYAVSGVEAGNQCYCTNALVPGSGGYRVADSECNTACSGDASLKCGGSNRLAVMTTANAAQAPTSNGMEGNIGCYTTGNVIAKATYDVVFSPMTPEYCRRTCRNKGSSGAFLLNGNRCLCGTAADAGAVQPATVCSTPCSGNSSVSCGGSGQVSLYDTSGAGALAPVLSQAGYVGCFINDNPSAFDFSTTSSSNTLQYCQRLCTSKGYPTFGTSGIYCNCGTKLPAMLQPEASCTTTCPGAGSTDKCGGSSRFSVFTSNNSPNIVTPSVSSASSTIASSSAASSSRPVSSSAASSSAILSSTLARSSTVVTSVASGTATSRASSVAPATSSGTAIRTGTTSAFGTSTTAATSTVRTSTAAGSSTIRTSATAATGTATVRTTAATGTATVRTSSVATGTGTKTLPGNNAIVTDSTTATAASSTAAAPNPTSSDPSNMGCYALDKKVMSAFEMSCSTLDPSMCKLLCRYKGFAYAAVTNGDTCLCGTGSMGLVQAQATTCSSKCTGDANQTCGGTNSMAVYRTSDVALPAMVVSRSRKANLIRKVKLGKSNSRRTGVHRI